MNIHLSPEISTYAHESVRRGRFPSLSAMVEQGLQLLSRQERHQAQFHAPDEQTLLAKLDEGLASLDAGKGIPADQAFERLRQELAVA
jgi:putative addiction module CopG family antidote